VIETLRGETSESSVITISSFSVGEWKMPRARTSRIGTPTRPPGAQTDAAGFREVPVTLRVVSQITESTDRARWPRLRGTLSMLDGVP